MKSEPERIPLINTPSASLPFYPNANRSLNCKTQGTTEFVGAVVHYTAGRRNRPESTIQWANNTKDKSAAYTFHLIDANGVFYQTHDFDEWGWHAGPSSHKKLKGNLSKQLMGIEIAAAGLLTEVRVQQPTAHGYPIGVCSVVGKAWFDKEPQQYYARYNDGRYGPDKGWYEAFTMQQEQSLVAFLTWALKNLPKMKAEYIVQHWEIAPGRKQDCEAALSMTAQELRDFLNLIA
jgi:N-acetyl-anhydromuramyl-L-alanine amidase AmpD